MNKWFAALSLLYGLGLGIWLIFYDPDINDRSRADLYRVGVYSYIVACSALVGWSSLREVYLRWRQGMLRLLAWPPALLITVGFWLFAKSLFFSDLWFRALGYPPPEVVLNTLLTFFAVAHGVFVGVWSQRRRDAQETGGG
jgi:hypothetical protein